MSILRNKSPLVPSLIHFSESGSYMTIELEYLTMTVKMDPLATAHFLENIGIVGLVEVVEQEIIITLSSKHFRDRRMTYSQFVLTFFLPALIRDWLGYSLHTQKANRKQLIIHHIKTSLCKQ